VIEFSNGPTVAEASGAALIVGVGANLAYDPAAAWVVEQMPWVAERFAHKEFTGAADKQVSVATGGTIPYADVVFVGLGDSPDGETVSRAVGSAARSLKQSQSICTSLHTACDNGARAVVLGVVLGAYSFDKHKSDPKPGKIETVVFLGGDDVSSAGAAEAEILADAVVMARDLVNEPAMYKSPETMAAIATEMANAHGIGITVLDEHQIEAERLGGLRGVSLGATNPARLVELRYEPAGATAFLALVGKGIVFDSGGLSIKPAAAMEEMKTDMSGAAAVFAAMKAIARLGLPIKVVGITPLTENMPGGGAVRPGDVLHTRNGKTIEVLNTDAEGRLVLADGLALAVEQGPDLVVDLATLTGACMIALGTKIAGLFGTDEAVAQVAAAAAAAGERVWPMPMPADYRKMIDSEIADMKNTGDKYGGAITAALLLKEFAGDGAWAHLDIAGPARSGDTDGYILKGGTGFGVRTIVELARAMASA
jgi:leucyl aminopeptidase